MSRRRVWFDGCRGADRAGVVQETFVVETVESVVVALIATSAVLHCT